MTTIRLGLVGLGKIARDQHLPAIAATQGIDLVAVASRNATADGVDNYTDLDAMLAGEPDLDAVVLCQPPQARFAAAQAALAAGKHVFLEKPPGATVSEAQALMSLASAQGKSLFAGWHSRFGAAVAPAKAWIAGQDVKQVTITWKEDVRHWHPGQHWIWEAGGFGVFDPGINALSILTEILPAPVHLTAADLEFPQNRQTPIAARLTFSGGVTADFDWRQTGPQTWDIEVQTPKGAMALRMGGNRLEVGGVHQSGQDSIMGEYPALYSRMAALVREGQSEVDLSPMVHVADALTLGRRVETEAFSF